METSNRCAGNGNGPEECVLVTTIEGLCVIVTTRDVEEEHLPILEAAFEAVLLRPGSIILDLNGTDWLSAGAFAIIGKWCTELRSHDRPLGIVTSSISIKLALQGLARCRGLQVFADLSSAVQALRPGAAAPLGTILVKEFGLERRQLHTALRRQRREGGLLGHILLVQKAISPLILAEALLRQSASYVGLSY